MVKDEVAEAERDELAAVPLETLEDVGMVANDEIGACIDARPRRLRQELRWRRGELISTVDLDHHHVGSGCPSVRDVGLDGAGSEPCSAAMIAASDPVLELGVHLDE